MKVEELCTVCKTKICFVLALQVKVVIVSYPENNILNLDFIIKTCFKPSYEP